MSCRGAEAGAGSPDEMPAALVALAAAAPVLLPLLLLAALRWPAARAMAVTALATAGLALAAFRVPPLRVAAAAIEGAVIALSILLILFGALLLSAQLAAGGAIRRIEGWLAAQSGDPRVQALLVAWLLGSFLEGAAGFGTPAAITAPLLVALRFPPVLAVVVALVGDSVAVVFGAVGTPLLVGMEEALAPLGPGVPGAAAIGRRAAGLDLIAGTMMPALLVMTLCIAAAGRAGLGPGGRAVPLSLAIGLAHTLATFAAASTLGPELPSLIGPAVGLGVALLLVRRGWLVPRAPFHLPPGEAAAEVVTRAPERPLPSLALALLPYGLVVLLLATSRARALPLGSWLRAVELAVPDLFGTSVGASLQPLYSPGFLFALVALAAVPLLGASAASLRDSASRSLAIGLRAAPALVAALVAVRIFLRSDVNAAELPAMPLVLARLAADATGAAWGPFAPWLGALGSFLAGSATFSNLLVAPVQHAVAGLHGLDATTVLALQAMGAAAGNMVCVHNVVAAAAVVNVTGREGDVIRRTFWPMAVYLTIAGALGALALR